MFRQSLNPERLPNLCTPYLCEDFPLTRSFCDHHSVLANLGHRIAPALVWWLTRGKDLGTSDLHLYGNRMVFTE